MKIDEFNCPIKTTLDIIDGKWKPLILFYLKDKVKRYGELRREIPNITKKVLTEQLRELENDGIVKRKSFDEVPPKVEYSLSKYGETIRPTLQTMADWGLEHQRRIKE